MDHKTASRMSELTRQFYERVSASFSETRERPWAGWEALEKVVGTGTGEGLRLLDVACGNLRYERFLEGRVQGLEAWCLDACPDLVGMCPCEAADVHFLESDLARVLLDDGADLGAEVPHDFDRCVSFGFAHHLPLLTQRQNLLSLLVERTRPGGLVCVTFWQFMRDERIMRKAVPVAGGGPYDFLLGWQSEAGVARFCPHATDEEIDALVQGLRGRVLEVARFSEDGRGHDLNRYLVLRRL